MVNRAILPQQNGSHIAIFYRCVFSAFGEVNQFLCYTSSILRFITFLEVCRDLNERPHPHPPCTEV